MLELVGGDKKLAEIFNNGSFATLYLSPRDYHRHPYANDWFTQNTCNTFPVVYSVLPAFIVNHIPRLFARNERCVCYFENRARPDGNDFGLGAINVSAMETVWHGLISSESKKDKNVFEYNDKEIILQRGRRNGTI